MIIPFRARKCFTTLSKIKDLSKNAKILDVGLGTGDLLNFFYKDGYKNLYGSDFNNYMRYDILQKFEINDIEKEAPFKEDLFDLVICTEVLEHTFNPIIVFENLVSKVNSNGYLFISIPLELGLINRFRILFGHNINNPLFIGSHIKYFKIKDIEELISKFSVMNEQNRFYGSIFKVGLHDEKYKILNYLANKFPNLFASQIGILLKKS